MSIPQPRFNEGDTFWIYRLDTQRTTLACPDCLGLKKWKVVTPSGTELETPCARCERSFSLRLPPLEHVKVVPHAAKLTVGCIKIDTSVGKNEWSRGVSQVSYMAVETGVGSGTVYYEDQCYATEAEALAVSKIKAAEKQKELDETPQTLEKIGLSELTVKDAKLAQLDTEIYLARSLGSALANYIDDQYQDFPVEGLDDRGEMLESLEGMLRRYPIASEPALVSGIDQLETALPEVSQGNYVSPLLSPEEVKALLRALGRTGRKNRSLAGSKGDEPADPSTERRAD